MDHLLFDVAASLDWRAAMLANTGSLFPDGHQVLFTYIFAPRRRSAFPITDTELKLMAAAAKMGLSRMPKKG